jgi:hypothetical protein
LYQKKLLLVRKELFCEIIKKYYKPLVQPVAHVGIPVPFPAPVAFAFSV